MSHLVGVVHHRAHIGGHERCRVVALEVRRLIGEQGVGGRVRLVEAVARELLHVVEQHGRLFFCEPVLAGAFVKDDAVLRHLLGLLLAHCAAQQIGATERITADDLRSLHHLFLIHHDAEGFLQHRLQAVVVILRRLGAVLARDVVRDQIHRTRTVQRVERGQVFQPRRLGLREQVLHACRFKLEDGDGIGVAEDLVDRLIVERQSLQVDLERRIEPLAEADRPVKDGQRGEAEEVELDQTDRFNIILVVLAHHRRTFVLRVERAEIGELSRCDQHTTRVHADVAG